MPRALALLQGGAREVAACALEQPVLVGVQQGLRPEALAQRAQHSRPVREGRLDLVPQPEAVQLTAGQLSAEVGLD